MKLSREEVEALADARYDDAGYETPEERLFGLLVDVADVYVKHLEEAAADHPAPFFAGTTPIECAMNGLHENLDMIRGDS